MTIINLITEGGKFVEFEGVQFENSDEGILPTHKIKLGEYNGTGASVEKFGIPIEMTKAQYDDIVEFKGEATSRVAGEPYTPTVELIQSSSIQIGTLDFEQPETLDMGWKQLWTILKGFRDRIGLLEQANETKKYTSYKLDGTTISGFAGDRSKAICKYDLSKGYRLEQVPFSANVEDSRHLVSLITAELGVITFLSANSGMIGAVELALDNGTNIAQTAHTPEE